METWRVFAAVLGALVVFGLLAAGWQALSGPSRGDCLRQQFENAYNLDGGGPGVPVNEDC